MTDPDPDPEPIPDPLTPSDAAARARRDARRPYLARRFGWSSGVATLVEWTVLVAGALLVALVLRAFIITAFWIPSPSMVPTLKIGDRIFVNQLAKHPDRGEIIVFRAPDRLAATGPDDLVKRVIGLPGDTVTARNGQVHINGVPLDEPYLPDGTTTPDFGPVEVPEAHYFMMGDNRTNSQDSRAFGPIPQGDVIGETLFRFWPLDRVGGI